MTTLNLGSGDDGLADATANININSESLVGRPYADMVSYQCTSVGPDNCITSATPNGIEAGDEVLLINWQGISSDYGNVGNYETFIVDSVVSSTISFVTPKTLFYGDGTTDVNIGTTSSNQRVMVQRVPQYTDLTIDSGVTLTGADAWGTFGGILFLRATGTMLVNGSIDMSGKGYTGGYNNLSGSWFYRTGAGISGGPRSAVKGSASYWTISNLGGGARGGWNGSIWACGAGGGYGTVGDDGDNETPAAETQGGSTYGDTTLSGLFLGSGGGSGEETGEELGDILSDGGGVIALFASTIDIYGNILCDGQQSEPDTPTNHPGGSGAGGSILIHAGTIYTRSSTFTAIGALGRKTNQPASYYGGDGGDGRIAISYATLGDSLASVDPVPYTDSNLELPYGIDGTANADCTVRVYDTDWNLVKVEAVTTGEYSVLNLPNEGPFNVVADPDSDGSNIISYKNVSGVQ